MDTARTSKTMNRYKDQDEIPVTVLTYSDIMDSLTKALAQTYRLEPSPHGRFCGYDVYKRDRPILPGVKVPSTFYYWRKLDPANDVDRVNFVTEVREYCQDQMAETEDKMAKSMWRQVILAFCDDLANPSSPVARYAFGQVPEVLNRTVSLFGTPGAHKYIPCLDWFTPELQAYNPEELLTLLPPAERAQLILMLGRAVVGASFTRAKEGSIEHSFRSYGILIGKTAGLGKSTLFKYLDDAFSSLGYVVTTLPPRETFGWGRAATADLVLQDDLVDSKQQSLMGSEQLKSLVSNNKLVTEEKGEHHRQIRSTAVVLMASNNANYSHDFTLDSGAISRRNLLDTYKIEELRKVYPGVDARTPQYWRATAERLDTTIETLAVRLLRHCADRFLEVTGYTLVNGQLVKNPDNDKLHDVIEFNRGQFRIDVNLNHVSELPEALSHLVALTIAQAGESDKKKLIKALDRMNFDTDALRILVQLFVDQPDPLEAPLDKLQLKHMSWSIRKAFAAKSKTWENWHHAKSMREAFGLVVKELESKRMFGYPNNPSHYEDTWSSEKRNVLDLVPRYQGVELTDAVDAAKDALANHMKSLLR